MVENSVTNLDNADTDIRNVSYSMLSLHSSCPHKYNLKYNLKIREDKPTLALIFGTSVHTLIQEWLTTIYSKSEKEGLKIKFNERFGEILKDELTKSREKLGYSLSDYISKETILENFNAYCNALYYLRKKRKKYFSLKNYKLIGIETKLDYKHEHNNNAINFIGYIDIILYNKITGRYTIIDLKTSNKGWYDSNKKNDSVLSQIRLYKYFYSKQFNCDIDDINVEYLIIKKTPNSFDDLPPNYIQRFSPANKGPSIKKALNKLNEFIDVLYTNNNNQPYTKVSDMCRFCEYNNTEHCSEDGRISSFDLLKNSTIGLNKVTKPKRSKTNKVDVDTTAITNNEI